jgi:ferric-dicitrate binding protein FerR (iron transport regulator)
MDDLLQRLLDGQIQPDEKARLQAAILQDPKVRDYYIDSLLACAVIRRSSQATGDLSESDLIHALSGGERLSASRRFVRHLRSVAAVLVLGAIILVSWTLLRHETQGQIVGRLTGVYEAQWDGPYPRPGRPLHAGSYDLREGLAQLELGEGASVLLQAPCQIEMNNIDEITLTSGKLTVAVSPQARGFRVRTPTVLITDLGTEFGVIAHTNGSTEAHVLKGRISMALDPNRSDRAEPLVVSEGLAAVVDEHGRTIRGGLAAQAESFLLQLPPSSQPAGSTERLNLADIVGGGNGHGTGRLDRGINLETGQVFSGPATMPNRSQRIEFRPLPRFRGIDGIFVPDGSRGPVVVSSTGLTFAQCPATTGMSYGGPANSGRVYAIQTGQVYTAKLNGVDYGSSKHPALNLHPNAGITFDLDRLRADNPDTRIERFTAVCGIPKNIPLTRASPADVWVLLDGTVRLHLHYAIDQNFVEKVDVPIGSEARFLTLASTCPGNAGFSWVFFGDPFLEPAVGE